MAAEALPALSPRKRASHCGNRLQHEEWVKTAPFFTSRELESDNYSNKILGCLDELRKQELLCDFTLEAEGMRLPVHRCVLVACSDYFRAMFTGRMRESKQSHSTLQGVTSVGLSAIVKFAYTGKVELTLENLEDVLSAASHLQVSEVMDLCSEFMESATTLENCVDVLNMTELYSLSACRQQIRRFILNVFDILSDTEHFHRLSATQMASLLSENGLRVTSEYRLFELITKWIDHDRPVREKHIAVLVKELRLPLLSGEELVEKVSPVNLMRHNLECNDLLSEAKDYHIVVGKQPLLQTARTQVRANSQSLVMCHSENLECFNLKTSKHAYLKDALVPLYNPCVCVIANFMYCCGGKYDNHENNEIATARCFRYDPRFDSWFELASMNEARKDFDVVAVENKLFAIAGQDENMVMCTVECFSIRKNEWEGRLSLSHAVYGHAVAVCDSLIYVSGGQRFDGYCNAVQAYNLKSDTWNDTPPLMSARSNHSMVSVNSKLYVLGGNVEDPYNFPIPITSVECFDPALQTWSICKATLNIREAGAVVVDEKVYIVGGINGQHYYSDLIQTFNPEKDSVDHVAKFPSRIYGKACCVLTLPQYV